jgi:hypothetical protein
MDALAARVISNLDSSSTLVEYSSVIADWLDGSLMNSGIDLLKGLNLTALHLDLVALAYWEFSGGSADIMVN